MAAPAGSTTTFIRSITNRTPASSSASERRTTSSTRSRKSGKVSGPANGAQSPSATERATIGTGRPAARAAVMAAAPSGSTATTRQAGLASRTARAVPQVRPPPPTLTTQTSTGPASSISSRPTVPWPATISGSSKGWMKVRPRSCWSRSHSAKASVVVSPWRITSAP